ncbi:hypothetical protein Goe20_02120 [Bacillus phage vB_BsuM-Goe20]|nr:hypothetical protein Goe20_02120 [Bacillus phage vB_BsuM-Goe20]
MSFKKLAALIPLEFGKEYLLSMDAIISVGFGMAAVQRNGETVYEESYAEEGVWTVQCAEDVAREDPDRDWRIHFIGPFSQEHYQRQGDKRWVLYARGDGIA